MTQQRTYQSPESPDRPPVVSHRPPDDRDERLRILRTRWDDLEAEYKEAQARNAQQHMTNLRGLMLIVKREIGRLGGRVPEFPYTAAQRRASG
jgi:hypothetical protein